MLALKYLLMAIGFGMILVAVGILAYDLYREMLYRRALAAPNAGLVPAVPQLRWRTSLALVLLAWGPMLVAFSIVVVPSGMGGVRVSQISGTLPGTLYPGVHFITPLIDSVQMFDLRDHMFTAGLGAQPAGKTSAEKAGLDVQSREGLNI